MLSNYTLHGLSRQCATIENISGEGLLPLLTGSMVDGGQRLTTKSSSNCVATHLPIGLNQSARGTTLNSCQHIEVELLTHAFVM